MKFVVSGKQITSDDGRKLHCLYASIERGNTIHLHSLRGCGDHSGSSILQYFIEFCRSSKYKRIDLQDVSATRCGKTYIPLYLMKLIERDQTFYEGFGFELCNATTHRVAIRSRAAISRAVRDFRTAVVNWKTLVSQYKSGNCRQIASLLRQYDFEFPVGCKNTHLPGANEINIIMANLFDPKTYKYSFVLRL